MLPPSSGGMSSRKTSGGASSRIFYIWGEAQIDSLYPLRRYIAFPHITYPTRSLVPSMVMPVVCSRRALFEHSSWAHTQLDAEHCADAVENPCHGFRIH